ncbi:uncharacterized protein LOC131327459 [Rhododendron vialii]|uniref:uncharacterized protein LOC131327459 n=1 Tax=Rhododendron vialii TaxID=182163 RepID=UPI0026601DA5|nr:uncharacterized protein LOC131327459 [Rhododendron vialii]
MLSFMVLFKKRFISGNHKTLLMTSFLLMYVSCIKPYMASNRPQEHGSDLVYVDDILITGSSSELVAAIGAQHSSSFALKDLGLPCESPSSLKPVTLENLTPLANPEHYRSLVGSLHYLTLTRREISFAVNTICQHMHAPLECHLTVVKRILRYIKDLGVQLTAPPILWCDNNSAFSLATNLVFHARTKHVEVDFHFVQEKIALKQFSIRHVPSMFQIANILTKPLTVARFLLLRDKLKLSQVPASVCGGLLTDKENEDRDHS